MTSTNLGRAQDLLERHPLVDGHNDLPWAMRLAVRYDLDAIDVGARTDRTQTDLPRLREGRVGAQFWSVYVPSSLPGDTAVTATLEQVDFVHALLQRYPDDLELALTADEVSAAFGAGRIASLLGAEGGQSIACSMGALRMLYRLGVRYLTLTHNDNVPWADSATDVEKVGGLTEFGREVVREMNRLGMLVDLSHVAASTMRAALATSEAPVLFTHSSCRALVDHPRNVPDDVLASLPGNGGVCMVAFVPDFVSEECRLWRAELRSELEARGVDVRNPAELFRARSENGLPPAPVATIAQVADHIEHVREVAGVEHVGVGGDYDGCDRFPEGLEDVAGYPALFAELLDRGWSEDDCVAVAGGNALRVLREGESVAARLIKERPASLATITALDG